MLWIDNLKAFVIVLVIIGHVVSWVMGEMAPRSIGNYLGMFDMPLFMAVSGYCSYKESVSFDKVKKRFWQLVIPFFLWPLVWHVIKMDFSGIGEYYFNLPLNPDSGLWFLYILFLITLVEFLRNKVLSLLDGNQTISGQYIYEFSTITTSLVLFLAYWAYKKIGVPGNWINFVALYYPCYMLGCVMRRHNECFMRNLKWLGVIGIAVFIPTAYFLEGTILRIPIGACGTLGAFFLFSKHFNIKMPRLVKFTGMSTLGIYAVHQPVINYVKHIVETPIWVDVILTFVITFVISIVAVRFLKIFRITRVLLLGIRS